MLVEYTVKVSNRFSQISEKLRVVFKITFINSEISRDFFFHFHILFLKLMIKLKKIIGKTCRS